MSAGQLFKIAPCTQEPLQLAHISVCDNHTAFVVVLLQLLFLLLICVHSCGVRSRDHLVLCPARASLSCPWSQRWFSSPREGDLARGEQAFQELRFSLSHLALKTGVLPREALS